MLLAESLNHIVQNISHKALSTLKTVRVGSIVSVFSVEKYAPNILRHIFFCFFPLSYMGSPSKVCHPLDRIIGRVSLDKVPSSVVKVSK